MHRTEQSAIWIAPKNGDGFAKSHNPYAGDIELELQDLALAYGPHMPAAYMLSFISDDLKSAAPARP